VASKRREVQLLFILLGLLLNPEDVLAGFYEAVVKM
jgi:hypothetical protein